MTKPNRKRKPTTGISVFKRGHKYTYNLDTGNHPLTGERQRDWKGGFANEDDAWEAALKAKAALDQGRHVSPSRRTVAEFMTEWLTSVRHSIKPTTYTNYVDYTDAYIAPVIGKRALQEIDVLVLNALYRHLLEQGRRKPDNNTVMYKYWRAKKAAGHEPPPREIALACKITIHAARAAVLRYRRGRAPKETTRGLAVKTVKNVHGLLHLALSDAVAWRYVYDNPAKNASLPRAERTKKKRAKPWTQEQLAAWLAVALKDRFAGLWVLVATTGMRRSELAGTVRNLLDLKKGTLTLEDTRVVVDGKAEESDGKTASSQRTISLDTYTVAALRRHLEMLDRERKAWGSSYPSGGHLFVFEDGRCPHPDTITRRFNKLVDQAGVPLIRLHDVRHTYATLSLDAGVDLKIVSDRIGHANVSVTAQIYSHRSTGQDRSAAQKMAGLILNFAQAMGSDETTIG